MITVDRPSPSMINVNINQFTLFKSHLLLFINWTTHREVHLLKLYASMIHMSMLGSCIQHASIRHCDSSGQKFTLQAICYRSQTKLREGNVFTPVCQSFCSQEREGQCTPSLADAPWADTPGADTLHSTPRRWPLKRAVRILPECILVA